MGYIMDAPLGQRILNGLNVSLTGMTITIISLVSLAVIIIVISKIINYFQNKINGVNTGRQKEENGFIQTSDGGGQNAGGSSSAAAGAVLGGGDNTTVDGGTPVVNNITTDVENDALVAIFAAAIARSTDGDARQFRIVSYKKTGQRAPVWNLRGRNEYLSGKI
jgi:Na+-transporting methylmalonyl-CoA/oxaloacetate decarboxylase gamma subunit